MEDVILFDVGNVIVRGSHEITHRIMRAKGVSPENAVKFFQNPEYREFSRGKITGTDFHRALCDKYLGRELTYQEVMNAHNEHIDSLDQYVVGVLNTVDNSRLAFVTDTNEWQTAKERDLITLSDYNERVFRSHKIGMLKTDEACFPYVIERLGVQPGRITLVDDSIEKIQMAQRFGINTILFTEGMDLLERIKL
ncbi:MAG: HAD-IA family hydrolase [Nanoarchaeota archaeon]